MDEEYDAIVRCSISYRSPDRHETILELNKTARVGRAPGDGGVVLTPEDQSISGTSVEIERRDSQVVIRNTSSFAQLDVHHEQGVRFLFPGEELATTSNVVIAIPGSIYTHHVNIDIEGARPDVAPTTGTTPLISAPFSVPDERRGALVGLCAARFFPERLGSALLTATDIARLLSAAGDPVSAKAVNNKLQRLRADIAQRLDVYLDTREDLADWAIRQGHVTRSDVEQLLAQ